MNHFIVTTFEGEKDMETRWKDEIVMTTLLVVSWAGLGFAIGTMVSSPSLPQGFNDAAKVGQVSQKQAVLACETAEDRWNNILEKARGSNKFAPEQHVNFNCRQASMTAIPAAPAGP
jgi:hypothetical protein